MVFVVFSYNSKARFIVCLFKCVCFNVQVQLFRRIETYRRTELILGRIVRFISRQHKLLKPDKRVFISLVGSVFVVHIIMYVYYGYKTVIGTIKICTIIIFFFVLWQRLRVCLLCILKKYCGSPIPRSMNLNLRLLYRSLHFTTKSFLPELGPRVVLTLQLDGCRFVQNLTFNFGFSPFVVFFYSHIIFCSLIQKTIFTLLLFYYLCK